MTTTVCDLPIGDLVAYADGELRAGRKELVEAHLAACSVCRRRMADLQAVDRILREGSPPLDDPAARARLRAALAQATPRRPPPRWLDHPWQHWAALAVVLVLVVAAWLGGASTTHADAGLLRFVHFVEHRAPRSLPPDRVTITPTPLPTAAPAALAALPFRPIAPSTLPLGLRLVRQVVPTPRRLESHYRNDQGWELALAEEREVDINYTIESRRGQFITIGGVQVFMQPDPEPGSVTALTWSQGGVLFTLSVSKRPLGGVPLTDARQIVEWLLNVP